MTRSVKKIKKKEKGTSYPIILDHLSEAFYFILFYLSMGKGPGCWPGGSDQDWTPDMWVYNLRPTGMRFAVKGALYTLWL